MNAARAGLGTSSQFTVHQLYAQGSAALADLEPVSGSVPRTFAGFYRQADGTWHLVWHALPGKTDTARIRAAMPLASSELVGSLDLKVAVAPSQAELRQSLVSFARRESPIVNPYHPKSSVISYVKLVRDGSGMWWGSVLAMPTDPSKDGLNIYGKYEGGRWILVDAESGDPPHNLFAPGVLAKLIPGG